MEKASKNKKEPKDEKQKDQKVEDQVIKSLEEAATPEDKFQLLLRKHVESERTSKKLTQHIKTQEKQLEAVLREKENLQREYNKSVLMRDKLQEVCREQQKLIKSVKNESMQKIREEEERRKESQSKFQSSLNEITQSLSKNNEENIKLRDHNIEMTKKLKFLAEQYKTREQQLEKLNEQVQLESQLHQAKMNKVQVEAAMEKEILIKEKQIALEKLLQTQKMIKELTEREAALKEQLNLYTTKYDDFQDSLEKSNNIFAAYKVEMQRMSKYIKKLEGEVRGWERKWQLSNASLIELATEKKDRDDHVMRCNKQVEQLQKLLRALQHERTHLYKVMRENNVECPSMPALPPEPEPIKPVSTGVDRDKMEMMSKNCAELKETLSNLQQQMKVLNLKSDAETKPKPEESIKKRKAKKQKGKNAKTNGTNVKESSPVSQCSNTENDTESCPLEASATEESTALPAKTENIEVDATEVDANEVDVNEVDADKVEAKEVTSNQENDVKTKVDAVEEVQIEETPITTSNISEEIVPN